MIDHSDCLICNKHRRISNLPPGGMIYDGKYFCICHAPPEIGPLGTLFIEARRHIIDFAEMTEEELVSYGKLIGIVYQELKAATLAERIYQVTMVDGLPHFHSWLIPRRPSDPKGIKFVSSDYECNINDAQALVLKLRLKFEQRQGEFELK